MTLSTIEQNTTLSPGKLSDKEVANAIPINTTKFQ